MQKKLLLFLSIITLTIRAQYNWTSSSSGFNTNASAIDIAIAPNGDVYLLSSQTSGFPPQQVPGLYKSTNNGNSWQALSLGNSLSLVKPTSIIFSGSKLMMAGSDNFTGNPNVVYTSADYGQNWVLANSGIPVNYELTDFAKSPSGDIYLVAAINNGSTYTPKLVSTSNAGTSWGIGSPTGLSSNLHPYAIYFDANGKLFLAGENSFTYNYVYTSTNFGSSWVLSNTNIPSTYFVNDFASNNAGEVFAVCNQTGGSSGNVPKIIRTVNGGANWSVLSGLTGINGMNYSTTIANVGGDFLWLGFALGSSGLDYIFRSVLPKKATVTTNTVNEITDVTATAELTLLNDGGVVNTSHGLCWSTTTNPSISTSQTLSTGSGTGIFTVTLANLQPSTTYYVKAFATNSVGVSYGEEINFTTTLASGINEITNKTFASIHPIPASAILYINMTANLSETDYSIYSVDGRVVMNIRLSGGENKLDISALTPGLYFLSGRSGEKIKIVKE